MFLVFVQQTSLNNMINNTKGVEKMSDDANDKTTNEENNTEVLDTSC
jgi:hypothetical protein